MILLARRVSKHLPLLRGALAGVALLSGCAQGPTEAPGPFPRPSPAAETVLVAAGDIVCEERSPGPCRHQDTSDLALAIAPDLVLALGDLQYEHGGGPEFARHYDASWGRLRAITRPVPGNHEYLTGDAEGYFDYFNGPFSDDGVAGRRGQGYYSFDRGGWHFVALNSNCAQVGGCQRGSPQETWLRDDLQGRRAGCTLAYWHHARFSSGVNGDAPELEPLWQVLHEYGADVALASHDHDYERFAPQGTGGVADPAAGIRQFVVGTGGHSQTAFVRVKPHSEVRLSGAFGVLRMTLRATGYAWAFVTLGGPIADQGSETCR